MYLLCNPTEHRGEQLSMLNVMPVREGDSIHFISEYADASKMPHVKPVGVQRLLKRWVISRGLIIPMFPYLATKEPPPRNVLFIHDELFSTTMIHAVFSKVFRKTKVMIFCAENLKFSLLKAMLARFFAFFVDCALCTSREAADKIEDTGVKRVVLCPLPVCETINGHRVVTEIKRIGYVGRLVDEKGIRVLCKAMKQLSHLEFDVYGHGYLEDELRDENVRCHGIFKYNREELDQIFKKIDLLVVPSISVGWWKEQFGRVIVEAMDRGVLVIGSNSGAIPEVIGNEEFIFQENSPEAIVSKIRHLELLSSDEIIARSKRFRQRFFDRYSNVVIKQVIESNIASIE